MSFTAPFGLRNPHINTILGGNGPRKLLIHRRSQSLRDNAHEVILNCSNGVRLHGEYSPNPVPSRGLVVMVHGWEGCSASSYLLSTASYLYERGFSIFRLHMRDHGPTHHLNAEPFLAVRLDEILDAIEQIQTRFPYDKNYLVGYSLGGNMVVRAMANIDDRPIKVNQAVAICPPVDPKNAGESIRYNLVYNRYFVNRWRTSLKKKIQHFPEHQANADILKLTDIIDLHEVFVPRYSDFPDAASYFKAYTLDADNLAKMDAPCHLIMAEDDPIIPIESARLLPELEGLTQECTPHGGHCGFLKDYRLNAWVDGRIETLLK